MTDWPDGLKVGPIREWPGELTSPTLRRVSPFQRNGRYVEDWQGKKTWKPGGPMPIGDTLKILDRELDELGARDADLLVAIDASQFRLDGRPRAQAKAEHPGVILSFTSPVVGSLSYPCDTFTTWEDNLRGVALALEALRKVDRYGVTKRGEQYRGFLAIEGATAMPAGFSSVGEAELFIMNLLGDADLDAMSQASIIRAAKRAAHPDTGGSAELFQRVTLAEQYLKENAR